MLMKNVLEYLKSLLAYFDIGPWLRYYDVALDMAGHIRSNAAILSDEAAAADHEERPLNQQPVAERNFLAAQVGGLSAFIARHDLLDQGRWGSTETTELSLLSFDILAGKGGDKIIPVLDKLIALLEIRRAAVSGRVRPRLSGYPASTPAPAAAAASSPAAGGLAMPRREVPPPDELALLWKTTEKLYDSWPLKLLGVLLVSAVLLAGGGTLLIGDKALQLRKNLEDAGSKEASDIAKLAKATRETVTEQSKTVLGDLDRQQADISQKISRADRQIRDLENRSEQIKSEAVERVVSLIRGDFTGLERKLQLDLEASLNKIRDDDINALKEKVTQLRVQVKAFADDLSDKQNLLKSAEPAIQTLVETATKAEELKAQADSIRAAKSSADDTLRKINEVLQSAQTVDSRVQQFAKDVESRLTPQMDKIIENEGKLGGSERGLRTVVDTIERIGVDTSSTQRILEGASRANNALNSIDDRLLQMKKRADDLDARIKPLPVTDTVPPARPALTEKDLDQDGWTKVQQSLKAGKFYRADVDGKVGGATRDAIGEYQAAQHAKKTRRLTPDQIKDLLGPSVNASRTSQGG
jgi:hypothetical protein